MTDQRRRDARGAAMRVGSLAPIVVLLAACGIQPTAVVDAGAPPSGFADSNPDPVINGPGASGNVYFISAGRLNPVSRPDLVVRAQQEDQAGEGVEPITLSMQELLNGPSPDEAAKGLRSEISLQPSQKPLLVTVPSLDPYIVQLVMPMVADDLSPLAVLQIACTVRAATQAAGHPNVIAVRRFEDGRMGLFPDCPIGPGS